MYTGERILASLGGQEEGGGALACEGNSQVKDLREPLPMQRARWWGLVTCLEVSGK